MDRRQRATLLMEAAVGDRERGLPSRVAAPGNPVGITSVALPGGGKTRLMRVMQTNACSLSCGYCPTFCGGKIRRVTLTPDEVAKTFMEAHRRGLADGLFLTSGVPGRPVAAMDRLLASLDVLRRREGFQGYVHVKMLPGAGASQVEEATRLANRISVNLEGPTDAHVRALAPEKDLGADLLPKLEQAGRRFLAARREREREGIRPAGTTTQFVVGAAGETDREILALVGRLWRQRLLHHAHFSAFQPVVGTPFEGRRPTPAMREHRLYQAEHLMRQYEFGPEELAFEVDGNLCLDHDPKTAWVLSHPEHFPLEVTTVPRSLLLRVPGIGPKAATLLTDRHITLRGLEDLRSAGVDTTRAGYFLMLRGRRLAKSPPPHQLRLLAHGEHLTTGPWKTPVPPCAYR